MSKTAVVGGSAEDRSTVIGLFEAYLDANSTFDWERLGRDLWSSAPEATFFNLNGHTYHGRDHWVSLWKYYKQHMDTGVWTPFDVGGVVGGDVAVIWCERHTKLRWVGSDPRPAERHEDEDFISRSTMSFRKDAEGWRVVHVHFSPASTDARPGGI